MIFDVIGYILSFLFFCWLMFLAYTTIKESKEERTKQHVKIIAVFFIFLFVSNTITSYNYDKSRELKSKMEMHSNFMLQGIYLTSMSLTDNLETLIDTIDGAEDKTDLSEIYPVWNYILEDAASMKEYTSFFLFPEYMNVLEDETRDLKQIITLTVASLFSLNEQIHLGQNYQLAPEERGKIEAIKDIYRKIWAEVGRSSNDGLSISKDLIDSLQKPMEIVSPNYTRISSIK